MRYKLYDREKAIKNKGILDSKSYIGTFSKDTVLKITKGRRNLFSVKEVK